eukprot:8895069-Pyramimonas_sp.AAC.1
MPESTTQFPKVLIVPSDKPTALIPAPDAIESHREECSMRLDPNPNFSARHLGDPRQWTVMDSFQVDVHRPP